MFDHEIAEKKHFTGKDGEQTFDMWKSKMQIPKQDFPFRVKTGMRTRSGQEIWLNVVSWGFYQGSDWRFYVFITYRQGSGSYTCAYHWDVDDNGIPIGTPRKHEWS